MMLARPRASCSPARPEQCIEWGRKACFPFEERERVDLKPYHYGLRFRKPGGLQRDSGKDTA